MVTVAAPLPVPQHFKASNADQWGYRADQGKIFDLAKQWAKMHDIKPTAVDKVNTHLLLIDVQKDFCFPQGSLYVGGRSGTGAVEDNKRLCRFIYENLGTISNITVTVDTHFPYQIFFPSFWEDDQGNPAGPYTVITTDEVRSGKWSPTKAMAHWLCNGNYSWLRKQAEFYCDTLEKGGKYALYLWPFHCMIGDEGHSLVGVVHEARLFHAFARVSPDLAEVKGGNLLTENYSVLSPEVLMRHDGHAMAQRNTKFIQTLIDADNVIIAGQAASHCVKSTIQDLLTEIQAKDPTLAQKVYIIEDCMSAVAVPDGKGGFIADYTPEAEAALKKFADAGMHVVRSDQALDTWPGIKL